MNLLYPSVSKFTAGRFQVSLDTPMLDPQSKP